MNQARPLRFKIATEAHEFEQIRRLNYRTFVEEIPQHAPNAEGMLVDRFDRDNTYAVCLRGDALVGMVSVCGKRPFSLDDKLAGLDGYLPPGRRVCEVRLLAVDPAHRSGVVFRGLIACLLRHCLRAGYDLAVISGTVRQLKLYRHLGFAPFGPLVGSVEAPYQPMYLMLEAFREWGEAFVPYAPELKPARFLPGPVDVAPHVQKALQAPAVSHRGPAFAALMADTRQALCALTGARHVQLLLGSGTLANDAVAAQLSRRTDPGVVLVNGEFGERLADHAARWRLSCAVLRRDWGHAFTRAEVEAALDRSPGAGWLWAVHCETSTGVLNDLDVLRDVCTPRGISLCLDAISAIGTVPVSLGGVHLATCVSGKGLGALPGLALVFHHHEIAPAPDLPRYLDLGYYAACDGVPFTHSSNLLRALRAALAPAGRLEEAERARDAAWLRAQLRSAGFHVLAGDDVASPAVTTLVLPPGLSSLAFGSQMERAGFLLSSGSAYLADRNWVQVCLMGCYQRDRLDPLVRAMTAVLEALHEEAGPVPA